MLRPIKNFLTYLQKNANGATIFGVSSNMNENNKSETASESDMNIEGAEMDKSPPICPSSKIQDQNENNVIQNANEVENSPTVNVAEEDVAELDACVDLSQSEDVRFTSELIVLESPDLNSSINSDPGIDPLAIDDYSDPVDSNAIVSLESSSDIDTCAEGGEVVFIVDVSKIKEYTERIAENDTSKDANEKRPNKDSTITSLDEINEEQEIRSDGSDSGLGSETSALQTTLAGSVDSSVVTDDSPVKIKIPARSNLKRRAIDEGDRVEKKPKRTIHFDGVKVYYFPRIQGFGCVPSQGGCTLGMGAHHISWKSFTLTEHAAEQRRAHKQQMQDINPRGSSSDESDSDEEISEASGSDLDADTNGFLQPVHARQRRALLKTAGVRKIDSTEKDDCRDIRNSREFCGCSCRGFCDPDTCSCSQAGIKCQVDRPNFPCGCSRDGCGNVVGRVEFNPGRVRTHFIHTIMRLELENRQQKRPDGLDSGIDSGYVNNSGGTSSQTATLSTCNTSSNENNFNNLNYNSSNLNRAHNFNEHMQPNNFINGHDNLYSNAIHSNVELGIDHQVSLPSLSADSIDGNNSCLLMSVPQSPFVNENTLNSNIILSSTNAHYNSYRDLTSTNTSSLLDFPISSGNMFSSYTEPSISPYIENHINSNSIYSNSAFSTYQQNYSNYVATTVASNCSPIVDTNILSNSNSFIDLHSPVGNSSRLDAINDLLDSSRNAPSAMETLTVPISATLNNPLPISTNTTCMSLSNPVSYSIDREDDTELVLGFHVDEPNGVALLKDDLTETLKSLESAMDDVSKVTPEVAIPSLQLSPKPVEILKENDELVSFEKTKTENQLLERSECIEIAEQKSDKTAIEISEPNSSSTVSFPELENLGKNVTETVEND